MENFLNFRTNLECFSLANLLMRYIPCDGQVCVSSFINVKNCFVIRLLSGWYGISDTLDQSRFDQSELSIPCVSSNDSNNVHSVEIMFGQNLARFESTSSTRRILDVPFPMWNFDDLPFFKLFFVCLTFSSKLTTSENPLNRFNKSQTVWHWDRHS